MVKASYPRVVRALECLPIGKIAGHGSEVNLIEAGEFTLLGRSQHRQGLTVQCCGHFGIETPYAGAEK